MSLGLLKKSPLMEGAYWALYLTLALHRSEWSSVEMPLKKELSHSLCYLCCFGNPNRKETAGPQLGHNSSAGEDVEILQDTTVLCCLVGCALA